MSEMQHNLSSVNPLVILSNRCGYVRRKPIMLHLLSVGILLFFFSFFACLRG